MFKGSLNDTLLEKESLNTNKQETFKSRQFCGRFDNAFYSLYQK